MKNNQLLRLLVLIFAVIYVVAPDLIPGPVDDFLVCVATAYARKKLMEVPTEAPVDYQ